MIQLIPRATKRGVKRERTRVYVPAMGFVARRRGALLRSWGDKPRLWLSEERARAALAREFPGEEVVLVEEERKTA